MPKFNESLTRSRFLPDRWIYRADLLRDSGIRLRAPVLVKCEDRRAPECAHAQITVRRDQFIVPTGCHRDDLTLGIDDDGMPKQLRSILCSCLSRGDRVAGVLIAPRLDR